MRVFLSRMLSGNDAVDDLLGDVLAQRLVGDLGAVLGGDDDGVDANRLVAVVFDRDLRLAVGPEVVEHAVAPRARETLAPACAPA